MNGCCIVHSVLLYICTSCLYEKACGTRRQRRQELLPPPAWCLSIYKYDPAPRPLRSERLVEVLEDVGDGLDADRQPDQLRLDAARELSLRRELRVRGCRRVNRERLRAADVGDVRCKRPCIGQ
jgi:hypothetical protein